MGRSVKSIVEELQSAYSVEGWWPSESPFEVAAGAILTQRTSWTNVQTALGNLRSVGMMAPEKISRCRQEALEKLVRPSGFYRQKARYLKAFSSHLVRGYGGDMGRMAKRPQAQLRRELLGLEGIGPETADTIMLYALGLPSFVVDAYSFRLLRRLGLYSGRDYSHVKDMFERSLGRDVRTLSNAHAAIVVHCKEHCKTRPVCDGCPLLSVCPSQVHDER